MKSAALALCRQGVALLPGNPREKHPNVRWASDPIWMHASEETVSREWEARPEGNLLMATGRRSGGIVVIDVDVHSVDGNDFIKRFVKGRRWFPKTWMSITGSGGNQYFYRSARPVANSVNGEIGIDIRGDGGIVVLPPSVHPNGNRYRWKPGYSPDDLPVANADDLVYEFIDAVRPKAPPARKNPVHSGEIVREGGRNDAAFRYGCRLRALGLSDEDVALGIAGFSACRCVPPLERGELEAIASSVLRYEHGPSLEDEISGLPDIGAPEGVVHHVRW